MFGITIVMLILIFYVLPIRQFFKIMHMYTYAIH